MKTTRILLFLSPLLLLLPSPTTVVERGSLGELIVSLFYSALMTYFPWNIVLAGVCWMFATHRGRSGFHWALFALFLPFLGPLVLAFVPAKAGSTSDELRQEALKAVEPDESQSPPEASRLPMIEQCVMELPEELRTERRAYFAGVKANLEFTVWVEEAQASRACAEATARDFTVWLDEGQSVRRFYGAGMVRQQGVESVYEWLCGVTAPGAKLSILVRDVDGSTRTFSFTGPPAGAADAESA